MSLIALVGIAMMTPIQDAGELANTRWNPDSVMGETFPVVRGARRPFVEFRSTSEVTGYGGVNNFRGKYSARDGKCDIGPLMSTRMAGPADVTRREASFLKALDDATSYRITGGTLRLSDGTGVIGSFVQTESLVPNDDPVNPDRRPGILKGRDWFAVSIRNTKYPTSVGGAGKLAFVNFRLDGRVVGNGGINGITGRYSSTDSALKVDAFASLRMAGPSDFMRRERIMVSALVDADEYRFEGEQLVILSKGRAIGRFASRSGD